MKQQIFMRLALAATLVVLGMTPSLAQGSQYYEDLGVIKTNTTSPATAPWFVDTVDSNSPYNLGQHVSVALHPVSGAPYISYYDASHESLQMANMSALAAIAARITTGRVRRWIILVMSGSTAPSRLIRQTTSPSFPTMTPPIAHSN